MAQLKLPRLSANTPILSGGPAKVAVSSLGQNGGGNAASREFSRHWNEAMSQIETTVNEVLAAQEAAAAANAAAAAANTAAAAANTAAADAADTADAVMSASNINNSYVSGLTLTAADAGTDATASISAHTRVYGDGTSVAVNAGTVLHLLYSTNYWIYYDQASRAGGAVTYAASTAPIGNRPPDQHFVGAISTPAALGAPSNGHGANPPGYAAP